MALIVGEAGVGKSRLAREVAVVAAATVLIGRASETSTPLAFRPFAEALLGAARLGVTVDRPELAPFRRALGPLVPDGAPDEIREGILRVLRLLAGATATVLLLEDLHWADPESLAVLEYLAAQLAAEPVLGLVTARTEGGLLGLPRPSWSTGPPRWSNWAA